MNQQLFQAIQNPCQGVQRIQNLLRNGAILTEEDAERNLITLIHNTTDVSITISILEFVLKETQLSPTKLFKAAQDICSYKIMDFLVVKTPHPIPDQYMAMRDQVAIIAKEQVYEYYHDWESNNSIL